MDSPTKKMPYLGIEKTQAETGTVCKISSFSNEEINVMDKNKVQVNNIGNERSVSFFTYEISKCKRKRSW